jgi:UPF0042 nucleotide-binding protein
VSDLRLISFGYLHLGADAGPPAADRVEDVRTRLEDPAAYQEVLAMLEQGPVDGRDPRVQEIVMGTAGATELLGDLVSYAMDRTAVTVAIGCGQGHDRSVGLVELAAARARERGRRVAVEHWHVDLPRVR